MKKWKNILDFALNIFLMFLLGYVAGGTVTGYFDAVGKLVLVLVNNAMFSEAFIRYHIRKYPIYGYLENSMFPVNPTKPYCF